MINNAIASISSWMNTNRKREMQGVTVEYSSISERAWKKWESVLDEWLPRLDQIGWLDGLNRIVIDNGSVDSGNAGQYSFFSECVFLTTSPTIITPFTVSTDRRDVLIHEVAHHAHRQNIGGFVFQHPSVDFEKMADTFAEVSDYATTNMYEAVAETATGTIVGETYSDEVYSVYRKLDGPEAIHSYHE